MDMTYTYRKDNQITFDRFTDSTKEYNCYWVKMCDACLRKHEEHLYPNVNYGATAFGTCNVKGCDNEAGYHVSFDIDEVKFAD